MSQCQVYYSFQIPYDAAVERCLVCVDSIYFSIDSKEIRAEFTPLQSSEFNAALKLNFNQKIPMTRNIRK